MIVPGRFQRLLLATCASAALVVAAPAADAIPLLNGFGGPTGYGTSDHCVHPNDDGSYAGPGGTGAPVAIDLRPAFPGGLGFFGRTFNTFFLNTNGNITFNAALGTYTPAPFPVADQPMIAPWWADVDTRGGGQPTNNSICYHLEPNRIVITWHNVGYYSAQNNRLNDFQMVLSTSGTCVTGGDFDVEFRYNRCEWTTGAASGGVNGLGGTPAQVGFDAGNRTNFVALPMSRTMAILEVCRTSNVPGGGPGLYRFQIRGGVLTDGCTGAGRPCMVPSRMGACEMGVTICAGMGTTCQQVNQARPRACNGFDNDCDGMVDEGDDLCPTGQVCDRGQCVDRCMPELGCLTGRTCSTRGTCVETSCADVTCMAGQRCVGGTCVGICDGVTCPWAQTCRAGRCVNPCAGVVCDGRDVCDDDPASTAFGQCVPGCQCRPCAAGRTCQPDGHCTIDACTGVSCPSGSHCEEGTCRDSCASAPDTRLCPTGEVCRLGECVAGAPPVLDAGVGQADSGRVPLGDVGRPFADTGTRTDTGRVTDSGRLPDGALIRADAGTYRWTQGSAGCSCRTGGLPSGSRPALGILALGAVLFARRRRRTTVDCAIARP